MKKSSTNKQKERGAKNRRIFYTIITCCIALLTVAVLFSSCHEKPAPRTCKIVDNVEGESFALFVPVNDGKLQKTTVDIEKDLTGKVRVERIIEELKKVNAIPAAISLIDSATDSEGTLYINLSRDVIDMQYTSALQEITTIYAMVNSFLMNIKNVKKVFFTVDGRLVHTFNGILDGYQPFEFNSDLVED